MIQPGSGLDPANLVDGVERSLTEAWRAGVLFERAEGLEYTGSSLEIEGTRLRNFGSCSYLGLDQRPELKAGAIAATERYGTQFSFSRAYVSCPLYEELEALLATITGGHVLVTPTTSLAHVAALPALIRPGDAVLIDKSTHASVHTATALLSGILVKPLRHGDLKALDREVEALSRSHRRVWYLSDGVYSMLGDFAPMEHIEALLARTRNLHVYIDDAHATSWLGKNGRGLALDHFVDRSRIVVALSLNKAFSAAGGALVFAKDEDRRRVQRSGPMLFSGPVQPPMLGAAISSAKLHLSPSFSGLQLELLDRIRLTSALAKQHGIGLALDELTPIFFVPCGTPEATFAVARGLRSRGFYASISVFPAVPTDKAGIRFTISLHNSEHDIGRLMESLAQELRAVRIPASGGAGISGVRAAFDAE